MKSASRPSSTTILPLRWRIVLQLLVSCTCVGWSGSTPCTAQAPERSRVIREIDIEGLSRESKANLVTALERNLRYGEDWSDAKINRAFEQLHQTGKFEEINWRKIDLDNGVKIVFTVKERPVVSSLRFVGRKALSEKHLRNEAPSLRTRVGSRLNRSHLVQDREAIREKYHAAGYNFASVKFHTETLPEGVRVIFEISEGVRVRVREVTFIGNKAFSSSELRSLMETRKKGWFFGLLTPGFYEYDDLQTDLLSLANYYRRYGYFDARAELETIEPSTDMTRLRIVIRIHEGDQYIFRGYRFRGNAVFSEQTLRDLTSTLPGQPYNFDEILRDREEIFNYYGNRAYIDARVDARPIPFEVGNDVFVRFEIVENNEVYIEELRVHGNEKTREEVIRREADMNPGERVDRSRITETESNLHRLQYFSDVYITYEEGSSPGNKHLIINVVEESTGRLILGFGVTSGFGIIGNFSISKRNFDITDFPDSFYDIPDSFTGNGQTLDIAAQPGTRRSLYRFTFVEPYLFKTRNALTLSASQLTIIREDYDEDRATFAPRIGHAFGFDRDFVASFGHRLEEVEIHRLEADAPTAAFEAKGHTTVIAVNSSLSYDKVLFEYLEGPYSGTNSVLFYEYAGGVLGGEVDFHKGELTNEFYFPLYEFQLGRDTLHHVISLNNRFGVIEPHHDLDEIPIFERFFLGGPNTVRGFRFRGMGPHENRDPIGGDIMWYGNLEYTFPLYTKMLRGVVFLDYGNLAREFDDLDFDRTRLVLGGGLRINFPFLGQPLPIGLYFGKAIRSEDEDRERLFLFTIGTRF